MSVAVTATAAVAWWRCSRCMYYAALRPAEAVNLRESDCELPSSGWGRIHLSKTTPEVGKRYTDSGALHDSKGLKHRPDDEVRPVPIPPELVKLLRWHLGEFGAPPMGGSSGNPTAA